MDQHSKGQLIQHVFIIGAKSIGQYGGYETFVDKLIEQHQFDTGIQYHVACKANGVGSMDESMLQNLKTIKKNKDGYSSELIYRNAHIFKISCPNIGPAVAIYYDCKALEYSIRYCKMNNVVSPIFYILTCRIGLFVKKYAQQIKSIGGKYLLNPDGHEWMRAKWSMPIKKYWKWSEKKMIGLADLIVCDSENIEKYINREYGRFNTKYIAYGADVSASTIDDIKFDEWLNKYLLKKYGYYLVVGRFVPENNYEIIMKEFMKSHTSKCLVLVTNDNGKLAKELAKKLNWKIDERIKFVGTIYDQKLIKKIRENAFAYLHGHEVGGTNPSLLEALASTKINLLLKVGFNEEVGQDAALYWSKEEGSLASLIESVECMDKFDVERLGLAAKQRIIDKYSWEFIGNEYKKLWKYISHH